MDAMTMSESVYEMWKLIEGGTINEMTTCSVTGIGVEAAVTDEHSSGDVTCGKGL